MQQHEHELQVTKLNKSSQWLVEVWQCNSTAFQWKDAILCFCILPASAEALVRCSGKIKYLLTVYFLGNIYTKIFAKSIMCVRVIVTRSSDTFWDTVYFKALWQESIWNM